MDLIKEIECLIERAIAEDIGKGDVTTIACIPEVTVTSGKFVLKQAGVVAGLPFLATLFKKLNPKIDVQLLVPEGSFQKSGTTIATVSGPAREILSGERLALNMLQHASGVATATQAFVRKVAGLNCVILDTRKTLPGLRALEKYAVKIGGGKNHRFGLDDRFIIKTNHLAFVSSSAPNPIMRAVDQAKSYNPSLLIEVEISEKNRLEEALKTEAASIMLVNMNPKDAKDCVKAIHKVGKKAYIESSGTITLDTVRAYAETGADGISIGAITHSVHALDISMRLL